MPRVGGGGGLFIHLSQKKRPFGLLMKFKPCVCACDGEPHVDHRRTCPISGDFLSLSTSSALSFLLLFISVFILSCLARGSWSSRNVPSRDSLSADAYSRTVQIWTTWSSFFFERFFFFLKEINNNNNKPEGKILVPQTYMNVRVPQRQKDRVDGRPTWWVLPRFFTLSSLGNLFQRFVSDL